MAELVYKKMLDVMCELESIGKNQTNGFSGYKFRGIDDTMNALNPLLKKHRLMIIPQVTNRTVDYTTTKNGQTQIHAVMTVQYQFVAEDGSVSIPCIMTGEACDTSDKACNKAMAVSMKYFLFQTFCIPTEEMKNIDPDNETPEIGMPKHEPANVSVSDKLPECTGQQLVAQTIKNLNMKNEDFVKMWDGLIAGHVVGVPARKPTKDLTYEEAKSLCSAVIQNRSAK